MGNQIYNESYKHGPLQSTCKYMCMSALENVKEYTGCDGGRRYSDRNSNALIFIFK